MSVVRWLHADFPSPFGPPLPGFRVRSLKIRLLVDLYCSDGLPSPPPHLSKYCGGLHHHNKNPRHAALSAISTMQRRQQQVGHRAAPMLRPNSAPGPIATTGQSKPLLAPANSLASSPGDSPRNAAAAAAARPTSAQPRLSQHRPAPVSPSKTPASAVASAAARAAAHEAQTIQVLSAATRSQNPKRFWAAKQGYWAAKRARALADAALVDERAAVRLQAVARGRLARRGVEPACAGRASPATMPLSPPPPMVSPLPPDCHLHVSSSVPQLGSFHPCTKMAAASEGKGIGVDAPATPTPFTMPVARRAPVARQAQVAHCHVAQAAEYIAEHVASPRQAAASRHAAAAEQDIATHSFQARQSQQLNASLSSARLHEVQRVECGAQRGAQHRAGQARTTFVAEYQRHGTTMAAPRHRHQARPAHPTHPAVHQAHRSSGQHEWVADHPAPSRVQSASTSSHVRPPRSFGHPQHGHPQHGQSSTHLSHGSPHGSPHDAAYVGSSRPALNSASPGLITRSRAPVMRDPPRWPTAAAAASIAAAGSTAAAAAAAATSTGSGGRSAAAKSAKGKATGLVTGTGLCLSSSSGRLFEGWIASAPTQRRYVCESILASRREARSSQHAVVRRFEAEEAARIRGEEPDLQLVEQREADRALKFFPVWQ